jgi:putative CocE/NonD family hydrolase
MNILNKSLHRLKQRSAVVLLFVFLLPFQVFAQETPRFDQEWVKQHFVKSEHLIPMRDGKKLYTAIYTPKNGKEKYPILMNRTPYSCRPYGVDQYRSRLGPNVYLMQEGYIFVYQDARGRYKSEGNFREMTPAIPVKKGSQDVDESSDTYDTIAWLLKNTNSNGQVGMYGISFPGYYSTAALPQAHPALKAVSPQAPMSDEFIGDDCYHNGAFFLMDNFGFYSGFDGPKNENGEGYAPHFRAKYQDAYQYFLDFGSLKKANAAPYFADSSSIWRQVVGHPTYDVFWQSRDIKRHLTQVKPAVLVVGGWYDAEDLYGALKTFSAIDRQSPKTNAKLVMGPWTHGGWAAPSWTSFSDYNFGTDVNKYYQMEVETKFFNYHLKNQGQFALAKATIFETGSNMWKNYESWPPANSQPIAYYLSEKGKFSPTKPILKDSHSEYISDPSKPVPYSPVIGAHRNNAYMAEDQRFAARRPDVLVFETDSLTEDLNLTGEVIANLFVSMTGSDADFIVKLIDVWPKDSFLEKEGQKSMAMDGYQQMVRSEVLRGKFRNSFSKPEPFQKDQVTPVTLKLNEVAHTFKKGHRVMVQVQSSWFPLVDRNPQKFMNIFEAEDNDFEKSLIRLHHDNTHSSHILLPVMR